MAGKNTIGTKIVIEGEKDYNDALRRLKTNQQELKSEMKLCSETYKENANSAEALRKKQEILTRQIEAQSEQVAIQEKKLNAANEAQTKAKEKVTEYKEALEKAERELARMEASSDAATEAIEAQKAEIQDLKGKLELAEQGYDKTRNATTRYQTDLNNANTELVKMQNEQHKVNGYLEEAEGSADQCAKSIDQYGRTVRDAAQDTEDFRARSTQAITALAGTIAASGIKQGIKNIADALMDCADAAKVFNTGMAKVYTIADDSVLAQSDMAAELIRMSTELAQSTDKLTEATYNAISAGVDTGDAVSFAGEATKLAVGGFTDASTAVDILTTTLNAYNLKADQTGKISDMLITTQNKGKTTVNELATNMGKLIPLAAAYNVEMDNLSTTYAIMTANGITTAETTTYIKAMLNELGDSGSAVGKTLRDKTGEAFGDLMKKGYSLGEAIEILGESVQGDTGAFNELWSSSEAGIGALSLLGSGVDKFNGVLAEMQNSTGATQAAFDKMNEQMAEERFLVAIDNLKTAIGTELNESLNKLYDVGADAFGWAADFVQEHPEVVKALEAVIITIGGIATAFTIATTASGAFKAMLAILNPTTALLTLAIGGVVGAVTALIATSKEERSEIIENAEATKNNTEKRKERIKVIEEEINAEKKRMTRIQELIQTISSLNDKQELNAAEQVEFIDAIKTLNELMPELNVQIDEQTGKLAENTAEFMRSASTATVLEEQNSLLEKRQKLYEEKAEAEKEATAAEKAYQEATEKTTQVQKEYEAALEATSESFFTLNPVATERNKIIDEGLNATIAAAKEEAAAKEAYEQSTAVLEELNQKYEEVNAYITANNDATNEAALVQINYKGRVVETTAEVAASLQNLDQEYAKAKQEAEQSLTSQAGLFEELSIKSDLSTKQMANALESQTEVFNQYKDDLLAATELVEQGLMDEGLLGSLKSLGVDGAGYLHELVTASEKDAEAYGKVMGKYEEMVTAKMSLIDTMGELETGYTKEADRLLSAQEKKHEEMLKKNKETYSEMRKTTAEEIAEMVRQQAEGMGAMVRTIEDRSPDIRLAAEGLCISAAAGFTGALGINDGSSEVFRASARSIPKGIAMGIMDGTEEIQKAMQDAVDNAASKIDLRGVAMAINRQLGEALI